MKIIAPLLIPFISPSLLLSPKIRQASGYSLFPNPSTGLVYFTLKNPGNRFKIEVVSREGRIVLQQKFEASGPDVTGVIDLTGFDKGVYFVKLITADGSSTKSIIIH